MINLFSGRAFLIVLALVFAVAFGSAIGVSKAVLWSMRENVIRAERESIERQVEAVKMKSLAADVAAYCRPDAGTNPIAKQKPKRKNNKRF